MGGENETQKNEVKHSVGRNTGEEFPHKLGCKSVVRIGTYSKRLDQSILYISSDI